MEWINQHSDWVSINLDGSYRFHLHSGQKVFSIERQVELPKFPWGGEQVVQIINVMAEMLPEWEEAKSQLIVEEPLSFSEE